MLDDELPVVHTLRHGQEVAGPDLVVMKPPNGLVRVLLSTVTDVAVGANERHQGCGPIHTPLLHTLPGGSDELQHLSELVDLASSKHRKYMKTLRKHRLCLIKKCLISEFPNHNR